MTCHNLAYHGWVPRAEVARQLDLPASVGAADGVDLLREGILAADLVNTVSPGFARESLTPEFGAGVDDALRSLGDRYLGIINGIDTELWNPATDAEIPARYSATDLAGQGRLPRRRCAPSWASIRTARSSPWSAGSTRRRASTWSPPRRRELLADGARICVLGTGDKRLIGDLQRLAESSRGTRPARGRRRASTALWHGACTPARTRS